MNKVIGYKLNRDESRKKVEKFYQDYIKNKWIEIFVELDKEYQKNLNVIINDVVRDFSKVCQRVIELQKRNEKGKVKYIYFSFLRTNILADNGDFRVDIYDENWFLEEEEAKNAPTEPVIDIEPKAEITFDDFMKLQFQVGEIIKCEEVPKSKKLLCSQVRIGSQVKQIVSGIKSNYTPEQMVGKKVMVLVNLKPAKLAGVMSEGMLLCAEDENGVLALMTPDKNMPAGAEIC